MDKLKGKFSGWFVFGESAPENIGIYGPPNSGKTTLTNRIIKESTGLGAEEEQDEEELEEELGSASHIPHETRRADKKEDVTIEHDGEEVTLNVVDTPGVETQVDYEEFVDYDDFEGDEEDAIERSREATEGISEAMRWLRGDIDGVVYVLDSTKDPFTQLNTMVMGVIESEDVPAVVLANKIDEEDSNVERIRNAFPQYDVIPVSALRGENMEEMYKSISENFG